MRKVLARAILCLAVLTFLAGVAPAANEKLDFKLVNKTGVDIQEVHISPASSNHWGPDVLTTDILVDGQTCELSFDPEEDAELWDLKVTDDEGTSIVWTQLDLTEITTCVLKIIDGKPVAEIH